MTIPIGYSVNDFYYMDTATDGVCKGYDGTRMSSVPCDQNRSSAESLQSVRTELTVIKDKYSDTLMLYNRELIVTVNMIFGVCMLIYYIYVNREVLPTIPKSMADIKLPNIEIPKAIPLMSVAK